MSHSCDGNLGIQNERDVQYQLQNIVLYIVIAVIKITTNTSCRLFTEHTQTIYIDPRAAWLLALVISSIDLLRDCSHYF